MFFGTFCTFGYFYMHLCFPWWVLCFSMVLLVLWFFWVFLHLCFSGWGLSFFLVLLALLVVLVLFSIFICTFVFPGGCCVFLWSFWIFLVFLHLCFSGWGLSISTVLLVLLGIFICIFVSRGGCCVFLWYFWYFWYFSVLLGAFKAELIRYVTNTQIQHFFSGTSKCQKMHGNATLLFLPKNCHSCIFLEKTQNLARAGAAGAAASAESKVQNL